MEENIFKGGKGYITINSIIKTKMVVRWSTLVVLKIFYFTFMHLYFEYEVKANWRLDMQYARKTYLKGAKVVSKLTQYLD